MTTTTSLPSIVTVATLDAPGLEPYRTLRRQSDHFHEGIFVAEGEKVVRRLFASGLSIRSMLLTPEWHGALFQSGSLRSPEEGAARFVPGARIFVAPKELLEGIVGYSLHQGLMAVAETPPEPTLGALLEGKRGGRLFVAVDDLVNAENVGLVVRNCAAFGADALICGETSSSAWLRRSVRASMGTVFALPIHHSTGLPDTLRELGARAGVVSVAADPAGDADLYETRLDGDICIVVGHEGSGIRPAVLAACSRRVSIPMWRGTDSLNVSSACAVILSEARRQRRR